MLVAKRQGGVGLGSLGVGHLEVVSVDGQRVTMTIHGVARPGGGANRRFGHMIHDK